jgi:hypothetical protein
MLEAASPGPADDSQDSDRGQRESEMSAWPTIHGLGSKAATAIPVARHLLESSEDGLLRGW